MWVEDYFQLDIMIRVNLSTNSILKLGRVNTKKLTYQDQDKVIQATAKINNWSKEMNSKDRNIEITWINGILIDHSKKRWRDKDK